MITAVFSNVDRIRWEDVVNNLGFRRKVLGSRLRCLGLVSRMLTETTSFYAVLPGRKWLIWEDDYMRRNSDGFNQRSGSFRCS